MKSATIVIALIWVLMVGGWIANLVKLIGLIGHTELLTMLPVLRIVGVFAAPLGSLLGFIPN